MVFPFHMKTKQNVGNFVESFCFSFTFIRERVERVKHVIKLKIRGAKETHRTDFRIRNQADQNGEILFLAFFRFP